MALVATGTLLACEDSEGARGFQIGSDSSTTPATPPTTTPPTTTPPNTDVTPPPATGTDAGGDMLSCMDTGTQQGQWDEYLCDNAADRCFLEPNAAVVTEIAATCGRTNCVAYANTQLSDTAKMAEAEQCMQDCIVPALEERLGGTISTECARCPARVVLCVSRQCLGECIADENSAECISCLCSPKEGEGVGGAAGSCRIDVFANCAGFADPPETNGCPSN